MSGKRYEVDLWTILMAIRYGTGRMTYANEDASRLARRYWDDFSAQARDQIFHDADRITNRFDRQAWAWLLERRTDEDSRA